MRAAYWEHRRVAITGHTGFKGAWLATLLKQFGSEVCGVSLPPDTSPNLFEILGLGDRVESHLFNILERTTLRDCLADFRPEVVFHLAAQSLVRRSYREPVDTFATNVVGSATLLDVVRELPSVKTVVVVTTDKCYENREWHWAYREADRLGGRDPYSASKACAEIAVQSMQKSFFAPYAPGGHPARIATVRAGNVVGGGDWSADRLVPDIVRGSLSGDGRVEIRNPDAVRPWQHVMDPLSGYIELAERLAEAPDGFDEAWNFGPDPGEERRVLDVARAVVKCLGQGEIVVREDPNALHEATLLRLDCAKARQKLGWKPALGFDDTIQYTAQWYRAWSVKQDMKRFTQRQISEYLAARGRVA